MKFEISDDTNEKCSRVRFQRKIEKYQEVEVRVVLDLGRHIMTNSYALMMKS